MDKRLLGYINWALLACMLLLYFTGVANLYSASGTRVETGFAFESFYQRQLVWGLCGLGCMLLAMLFDYRQLRNLAWPAYLVFLILLMLVPLVGSTFYGAKRWISFGLFTIQPSEPIKIAVLILVARLLARDSQPLGWKNFISVLAVGLVPMVFILKQPDLGTATLVSIAGLSVIFFAGVSARIVALCSGALVLSMPLLWTFMHDYQRERVLTLLDPTLDPLGKGFHILQALIAIGSGGVTGKGWMEGTQAHLDFIPERTSDFIFAVFGEEFGFVGAALLLLLYLALIARSFYIAAGAPTRFARLLAGSIGVIFFTYTFVNIGMVSGILPVVGVPLPFMSYGGTALLILGTSTGILLAISAESKD